MRILEFDEKKGIMKIKVENEDDLWLLNYILEKGDKVIARTTRDISMGNEARRVPLVVELIVERTEFQAFTTRLRIHGIISDAPEKFNIKGFHHTINLDVGEEIIIIKGKWSSHVLEKIKKQEERRSKILIVLVDFDEVLIAIPMLQGIKILVERNLRGLSKDQDHIIEENAKEIAKEVEEFAKRFSIDAVVIAGPGPFKEIVAEKLKNLKIYLDSVSSATRAGLNEILKRDIITQVIRDYEIAEATKIFEKIMEILAKSGGNVAYGLEEVRIAAEYGAVEKLLIIEDLMASNDVNLKETVISTLEIVENKNGKILIIPKDSPIYHQVKNLSGIVALLRFPIK
jgi:protein pelota